MTLDHGMIGAWLAARSLARGLPAPVAEPGGWRVESGQPRERRRYLFPDPCDRLRALGRTVDAPLVALKLCRPGAELMALLPPRWRLTDDNRMMVRDSAGEDEAPIPDGYALTLRSDGPVVAATILTTRGEVAATGHAAAADGVFIYDRIVVEEAHRRRGLGRVLMAALGRERRDPAAREVLTATAMGRALYLRLGWRDYCPWATAMLPGDGAGGAQPVR